ncbi:MAG: tetratricopeptide repeat protein [Pseudomonadota bacterium]
MIYRRLTQGCLAGEAYHGLGKVAGEKGEWIEAEQLLKRAVRHDPISSRKHNDLGYAHLKTGASGLAIEEFRTALELDPGRSRSANNLILALLIAGESAEAQRISRRLDLDQGRWRALQRQAAEWEASRVSANPVPPADSADIDNRSGDQGEHVSRPTGEMTPTVGAVSGDGADMTGEKAEPSELDGQPAPEKQAERFEGGDESSDAEAGAANAGKASSDTDDAAVESGDEPSDEESEMPEKEDQS